MKAMRRLLMAALAAGLVSAAVVAGTSATKTSRPAAGRAVYGGPFYGLKGLSDDVRQKLAVLWTEAKEKEAAAKADSEKAMKTFETKGEEVLNDAQKADLKAVRAAREERAKLMRERPTMSRPAPRPTVRAMGPLAELKDLTDDQVKKINELAAARESTRKASQEAMRTAVAAADKAYNEGLDQVLTDEQKAGLRAAAEKAKADAEKARADREAALKRAADERKLREFGGEFAQVKTLADDQKLALGRLWRETQDAVAAAAKAAKSATDEYVEKGRQLLTDEQKKLLDELSKPKPPAPRPAPRT